jgi:hypothetical protein
MRTDTKIFKTKLKKALRGSREKWVTDPEEYNYSGDDCGFCRMFDSVGGSGCDECCDIFWHKIGLRETGKSQACISGIPCSDSDAGAIWKRACTIMNKRFDKIAKLYGVDA